MWPNGEYAIPRSVYGCPDNELNNWKYGYMRLIFPHRYHLDRQQYEEGVGIPQSQEYVLGLVGKNTFQMNFCAKIPEDAAGHIDSAEWPGGSYSIYQWATKCPEGRFTRGRTYGIYFRFCYYYYFIFLFLFYTYIQTCVRFKNCLWPHWTFHFLWNSYLKNIPG